MTRKPIGKRVAAVVIGRNEGERLGACLASLAGQIERVVYVDSGSNDGSPELAKAKGATVVVLSADKPFTAARARNVGLKALAANPPEFVQFLDGDTELREGWLEAAVAFLDAHPKVAIVCGRRRERFPEASIFNRLIDAEWDTPLGPAKACGGDALARYAIVCAVGGFRDDLIAGEEPELCLRLRQAGWMIWRLDAEMTWHDARMMRFWQWWRRSERAGHAFAEGAHRFATHYEPHWRAETRRALLWGFGIPALGILGGLIHPAAFAILLAWPAQALRLTLRYGWERGIFLTLGKLPEAIGIVRYHLNRLRGRARSLIEYR